MAAAQAEVLLALGADVVCLQEVTRTTRPLWKAALEGAGLECAPAAAHPRRLEVMIAARAGIEAVLSSLPGLLWPERHLAVRTAGVEVHTLHAPTSQREDLVKVRTLEALGAALLAGDVRGCSRGTSTRPAPSPPRARSSPSPAHARAASGVGGSRSASATTPPSCSCSEGCPAGRTPSAPSTATRGATGRGALRGASPTASTMSSARRAHRYRLRLPPPMAGGRPVRPRGDVGRNSAGSVTTDELTLGGPDLLGWFGAEGQRVLRARDRDVENGPRCTAKSYSKTGAVRGPAFPSSRSSHCRDGAVDQRHPTARAVRRTRHVRRRGSGS